MPTFHVPDREGHFTRDPSGSVSIAESVTKELRGPEVTLAGRAKSDEVVWVVGYLLSLCWGEAA